MSKERKSDEHWWLIEWRQEGGEWEPWSIEKTVVAARIEKNKGWLAAMPSLDIRIRKVVPS